MQPSDLSPHHSARFEARLRRRRRAEQRFRFYGQFAIGFAATLLIILLVTIGLQAKSAFSRYEVQVQISSSSYTTRSISYDIRNDLYRVFPEASFDRVAGKEVRGLVSTLSAKSVPRGRDHKTPTWTTYVPLSDQIDRYLKGKSTRVTHSQLTKPELTAEAFKAVMSSSDDLTQLLGPLLRMKTFSDQSVDELLTAPSSLLIVLSDGTYRLTGAGGSGRTLKPVLNWDVPASARGKVMVVETPEAQRALSDIELSAVEALRVKKRLRQSLNTALLFSSDSSEPELAGVFAAMIGSILIVLVTMCFAMPAGIAAAIYLEEFAPRNWVNRLITATINNLAAVPTIVFGLLGAAFLINGIRFELPFTDTMIQLGGGLGRGWPLVGGLVLGLIALPTVIISARSAIAAVPATVRQASVGLGASKVQSVAHHVLPEAAPGMLTGSIFALAQAMGEAAPLLLIGMFAFVGDAPAGINDRSSALPVLIFQWATRPERAWEANTAAAVVILLFLMLAMNAMAIWIRMKLSNRAG